MHTTVAGCSITINYSTKVTFDYPIEETVNVGGVAIVILQIPDSGGMTENVFGVTAKNRVIWKIERIDGTATDPVNRYVGFGNQRDNHIYVSNWNGVVVEIDAQTGKIVKSEWLK